MNKETKKQLVLSAVMLFFIVCTMILWYDNFIFHTYVNQVDYQFCFRGSNDDILIEGFEMFQNNQKAYEGQGRIMALKNDFFKKGDKIQCQLTFQDSHQQDYKYTHVYQVKNDNEVCYLDLQEDAIKNYQFQVTQIKGQITITRQKKVIYDQPLYLVAQDLSVYNGSNKDYSIQDVYVGESWLKTGYLTSTIDHLSSSYEQCVIDYVCIDKDQTAKDINDYERIAQISAKTSEVLNHQKQEVCYYEEGNLLDKDIKCVITLFNQDEEPLTFVMNLSSAMKAGVSHE